MDKEILAECPCNCNGTYLLLDNSPCEESIRRGECLVIQMGKQTVEK